MNTANPQLEGLYLALAAVNRLLVDKGIVSNAELQDVLQATERAVLADDKPLNVSSSHQKAVAFPIRLLLLANEAHEEGKAFCFDDLAREIGRRT
ncbi:hypothetical protein [Neorhizobium alkalisoli]|jgi:hypothetical protein|uniref:hypothetical protein n=1 Tax=Neorhizobium alkalisoli TaxID=528178 RepID=UPI000CF9C451|nr:hypothetical protein [Neorhizobium alkalisoli]